MKTSRTTLLLATTALAGAALAADDAFATDDTATIQISAYVEESCSISTDPILFEFGTYDDTQKILYRNVEFSCPDGKSVTFEIAGGSPDGSGSRSLPNVEYPDSTPLSYFLYDPEGGVFNGTGYTTTATSSETDTWQIQALMVAGQLASLRTGEFSDDLTLSMTVNP